LISTNNCMLKLHNPVQNETFSTLLSMGYKTEMISQAMSDSRNQSLEEILDLLLFHEEKYIKSLTQNNKVLKKESFDNSQNIFDELGPVKVRKNSHKKKIIKTEEKRLGHRRDSPKDNPNNLEDKSTQSQPFTLPKSMDDESITYINNIRKTLDQVDSKDPNEYVSTLSDHLKGLKFNTSEVGQAVHRFLLSGTQFKQVIDVRKKIYEVVMKVMTNKRQSKLDLQEFEYVLLMSFEMKLLNVKQMEVILSTYNKFCNKAGHSQDDILISSLERYHSDAKKAQSNVGGPTVQDVDNFLLTDIAVMKCPNVTSVLHERISNNNFEEFKISDMEENVKKGEKRSSDHHSNEKQFCIICTDKTREIIFAMLSFLDMPNVFT